MRGCKLFLISPQVGDRAATIDPSEPEHQVPQRFGGIPGYVERTREVMLGRRAPWWGTEYRSIGSFPSDFVHGMPPGVVAVSERFKNLMEGLGVGGVKYHSVTVDGSVTMYILGVEGRVAIDSGAMELQLLEGAELGLYKEVTLYASPGLMEAIRREGIDVYSRCAVSA